ncbi:MAG: endoplasmic reticulum-Golgi intermediate compartment protein [archaeon]|nr:endoplasmic reticulum-Golgi intermediate compartment protein [archaeon]
MGLLFINELSSFLEVKTTSNMIVDINRGGSKMPINIDVELQNLPCSIISIDLQDVMGAHSVNLEGNMTRSTLDKMGKILSTEPYKVHSVMKHADHDHYEQPDYEKVKKAIMNKEGCKIQGTFLVNKVPGNFHISSHAFGPTISRLAMEGVLMVNLNHKIKHLSFGDKEEIAKVKNTFKEGLINPMDGIIQDKKTRTTFEYYIKVVPTTYQSLNGNKTYLNQFNYHMSSAPSGTSYPSVYFKYELSPVTVEYIQYKSKFLSFFIEICAILGGVFTITGIIDALIHQSMLSILRKAERGKLG